jgi:tetratricopeptide (TPR) repeat protein
MKNPQLPDAHRNLALLLAVTGRLKEANYHFEAAQQLSPIDSEMAQRFSELVVTQLDAAIAMYRQSVKLHPRDAAAHGNLARHLAARRQNSEAIKHLRIALELKPDWLDGANNLAWMLSTLSNPELRNGPEAVKWATVVCDRTEHANVEYLDTLAAAYAETGDFSEATRIAETALQMARASGQQELARMVESRVRLYRNKQPYREESTQTDLPQSSTSRAEIR